jgi:hypothetical protein
VDDLSFLLIHLHVCNLSGRSSCEHDFELVPAASGPAKLAFWQHYMPRSFKFRVCQCSPFITALTLRSAMVLFRTFMFLRGLSAIDWHVTGSPGGLRKQPRSGMHKCRCVRARAEHCQEQC